MGPETFFLRALYYSLALIDFANYLRVEQLVCGCSWEWACFFEVPSVLEKVVDSLEFFRVFRNENLGGEGGNIAGITIIRSYLVFYLVIFIVICFIFTSKY